MDGEWVRQADTSEYYHGSVIHVVDEKPTSKDLTLIKWKDGTEKCRLRILDEVCNKWEKIGTTLCIPYTTLQMWSMQNDNDPEKCCTMVFRSWFENPPEDYPITWGGFIELLEDVQFKELAKKLRKALIHRHRTS